MATALFPSADKRPLHSCPTCSSSLCEHLVCRVCDDCEQCDSANASEDVPMRSDSEPHKERTSSERLPLNEMRRAVLHKLGVADADMPDAARALDELDGNCCVCGNRKRPKQSFCAACFRSLPQRIKHGLYRHISAGYLGYVREAWRLLEASRSGNGGR